MVNMSQGRIIGLILVILLMSCSAQAKIKPFTTDGCSLFPDRSPFSDKDWYTCCLDHDLAYWRGGTADERETADRVFKECVAREMDNEAMSSAMYHGVGVGGSPYLYTWFRWGYGWEYGRGYDPVTAEEEEQVEARLKEYYEGSPDATCGK